MVSLDKGSIRILAILFGLMLISSVSVAFAQPNDNSKGKIQTQIEDKIILNHVKKTAKIGQTIKISGTVQLANGNPEGLIVHIKDHDFFDFDDSLARATVDSKGKFSTSWTVKDVDSNDRQYSSLLLSYLDPSLSLLSDGNELLNDYESDTVELYAQVITSDYTKLTTCGEKEGLTSWDYCRNNTIKLIEGNPNKVDTSSDGDSFWELINWFL